MFTKFVICSIIYNYVKKKGRKKVSFKETMRTMLNLPDKEDTVEYFDLKLRVSANVLSNAGSMPTIGYNYRADVTKLMEEFAKLRQEADYHLTFNTVMLRVLVEGLKAAPRLNAHIDYKPLSSCARLIVKKHIDVAVPVVLEDGKTFVVKLLNIENDDMKTIAAKLADVTARTANTDLNKALGDVVVDRVLSFVAQGKFISVFAQMFTGLFGKYKVSKPIELLKKYKPNNSLHKNEINEGTVCMTNWGTLYSGYTGDATITPLLYPQVFLMAIGNLRDTEYAFRNDKGEVDLATKKELPITFVIDHRIGAFNDVLPFMKRLDEIFANPEIIREW